MFGRKRSLRSRPPKGRRTQNLLQRAVRRPKIYCTVTKTANVVNNPVDPKGVAVGSTVAFFGNRTFAFRDTEPEMAPQLIRFVATVSVGMAVHASLVHVLADMFTVPVVLAKLIADLAVFGLGQLFLLRYVVFPKAKEPKWLRAAGALPQQKKDVRDSAARAA